MGRFGLDTLAAVPYHRGMSIVTEDIGRVQLIELRQQAHYWQAQGHQWMAQGELAIEAMDRALAHRDRLPPDEAAVADAVLGCR